MAEHRLVLGAHIAALLEISDAGATARLRALAGAGYVTSRQIFHAQPAAHQITREGLRAIVSELPAPRIDLRCYRHDLELAWLWLAARSGALGPLSELISERRMRSQDGVLAAVGEGPSGVTPFGVRLGGAGAQGQERRHYADLMLITPEEQRIAVELELSRKGRFRVSQILTGYGSDPGVTAVLYLVKDSLLARSIESTARRLGIGDRVHVQWARSAQPEVGALPPVRTAQRSSEVVR